MGQGMPKTEPETETKPNALAQWLADQDTNDVEELIALAADSFREGVETALREHQDLGGPKLRWWVAQHNAKSADPWDLGAHLGNLLLLQIAEAQETKKP